MQHKDRLSDEERAARRKANAAKYREANREKCNAATRKSHAADPEAKRARDNAWRAANADRIKAQQLEYRKANRARLNAGTRQWQRRNHEHFKAYQRQYQEENRVATRRRVRMWRIANPERSAAYAAQWAENNRGLRVVNEHNRRARKRAAGGKVSRDIFTRLMKLQKGKCAVCRADLNRVGRHLDHVMPLALGGAHDDSNVQLLCPKCNLSKGHKHPGEFMRGKGYLL